MDDMTELSLSAARTAWSALRGDPAALRHVQFTTAGALPSCFAVTDIAAASVAVAALALDEWIAPRGDPLPIHVDRRLCSFWFRTSLRPSGWDLQNGWDVFAGDYAADDGWIRLHTNAPHHRTAARRVLGNPVDRDATARAVSAWRKQELEDAVVAAGGCAAVMHSRDEWNDHPQGIAIAGEPLIQWTRTTSEAASPARHTPINPLRPLAGIRVLDLTRVIAGPAASRFLAGYGAEVLRIDPPDWDDAGLTPEMSPGKRCAWLDLKTAEGRAIFMELLKQADVLLHGYRADALEQLGIDGETRATIRPGLVDVALNAYGWSGPWRNRRGFDSLVQMSIGIAEAGMQWQHSQKPVPLPVQALDHATGYLMAAAALRGLCMRRAEGAGSTARLSLARTGSWLCQIPDTGDQAQFADLTESDFNETIEMTAWGPAQRLRQPAAVGDVPLQWEAGAQPLGSAQAKWL
jgi:crotonobetainyl-CoA:carnitine CoA-transferase CaiB-like acyl-CoA transferase